EAAVEAIRRGGRVLVGQCHESDQALPFGPWVDLLRTARAELGPELGGLTPAWRAELARLLPELSEAATPPEGPAHHRRLFEAVAGLAQSLARAPPPVLVLEDIHWADEPSLRLPGPLRPPAPRRPPPLRPHRPAGGRPAAGPAFVGGGGGGGVLAAAPGRPRMLALATGAASVLALGPLSRPDTARLVTALRRRGADAETTSQLADRVWAVSEGHPL